MLVTGRIERVKYRFGREYMPEIIVKDRELVNNDIIYEQIDDNIVFEVGAKIHLKNIGADVLIINKKKYPSGETIYETDYVIKTVEDEITHLSLEKSKVDYRDYVELRESVISKLESKPSIVHKEKSWFGKIFG